MLRARKMTEANRTYEARRARGWVSLDNGSPPRNAIRLAEEKAKAKAVEAAKPAKPTGVLQALLNGPQAPGILTHPRRTRRLEHRSPQAVGLGRAERRRGGGWMWPHLVGDPATFLDRLRTEAEGTPVRSA